MRRTKSVLVVAGGLIALAACGSSGGSASSGGAYGGGGKSSSTTAAKVAAAKGGPVTVITAKDFAFTPDAPNLAADGATIHVANTGAVQHNLTVEGLKVNKNLPPGSSFDINVNAKPGTYQFHCEYHPTTMKGAITVP
jgi:plastocyanin